MKKILKITVILLLITGCSQKSDLPPIYEKEYASVSKIIGNEIKLKIGAPLDQEESGEAESPVSLPSDDGAMMGEAQESEGLQLIYSGEEEEFIIGTGTEIMSMGEIGSLKDIKKGNIIQFERDDNNTLIRITVM